MASNAEARAYSSYQTQQQMLERMDRLEIMLHLLIEQTQLPPDEGTRALLLNFAGVIKVERPEEAK